MTAKHILDVKGFLRDVKNLAEEGRPKEALSLILTRKDYETWEKKYLICLAGQVYMTLRLGALK